MTAPMRLRLDQAKRTAVSERYEHARRAVERTNCQMVLLADKGRHATEDAARNYLMLMSWAVSATPDDVAVDRNRSCDGSSPRS